MAERQSSLWVKKTNCVPILHRYIQRYLNLFTHPLPQKGHRLAGHKHLSYPIWKCKLGWARRGTIFGRGDLPQPPSGAPWSGWGAPPPVSWLSSAVSGSLLPVSSGDTISDWCLVFQSVHEEPAEHKEQKARVSRPFVNRNWWKNFSLRDNEK